MHRARSRSSLGPILLVFGLTACNALGFTSKPKDPAGATKPASVAAMPSGRSETSQRAAFDPSLALPGGDPVNAEGVSVSAMIAKACGLTPRGKTEIPTFDYDSAALGVQDRELLADIARCLSEGALRGKSVVLIGRADSRGEPEYNMTLGESRADAVHRYLVDLGVGRDRMRSTSRGELDAIGTTEEGWAHDRRVDIELAL